eukprot:1148914-Pelagomonas_calceolata.AAC.5
MFLAPIQTMLLIQYSTCSVVQPNQGGGFLRTPLWHIQPPYTQNWQLSIMQGSSKSGKGLAHQKQVQGLLVRTLQAC